MFCQKCRIEYDESRTYCRNCGSLLSVDKKVSTGDTGHSSPDERSRRSDSTRRMIRICPRCHLRFEVGNYCRICGASLKKEDIPPGMERSQEKRLIRSLSSEWFRLIKWKSRLEIFLGNLEKQRNALPEDTFNLTFHSYQVQVESLSSRLREIEAKLEAVRTTVSEKIRLLEEDSDTLQKRLNELCSLRQLGAITYTDYSAEKNGIKQQMRPRMKSLKECRKTISRLSVHSRGGSVSPRRTRNLIRRQSLAIAVGVLIIVAAASAFFWMKNDKDNPPQESTQLSQTKLSVQGQLPTSSPKVREDEKIKSLFETIRRANLEKKIDLFMSCYAVHFKDKSKKRLAILESWNTFDYLDLSYDIKKMTVTAQTAKVRVEWLGNLSPKHGGTPEKTKSVLDVSLKKEDGHWKIGTIRPVT